MSGNKRRIATCVAGALVVLAMTLASARAARADWTWQETQVTTIQMGQTVRELARTQQGYTIKNNVARIDNLSAGVASLYNFTQGSAVLISFPTRSFVLTPMAGLIQANQEHRQLVKSELDQEAQAAAAMGGPEPELKLAQIAAQRKKYDLWEKAPYEVRRLEGGDTVAGHACVKYAGMSGPEQFQELWIATDLPLDPDFGQMFAPGMFQLDPQLNAHLGKVPGLPLKVVSHYGAVTVTTEVTAVSTGKAPLDAFLIPEGFREAE
jgi:hypothetical protein